MMATRVPDLLGTDVGFSATRRSTGLAALGHGGLCLRHLHRNQIEDRLPALNATFLVSALDAPVLVPCHQEIRACERLFSFGLFGRRCRPGFSHVPGTGLQLRAAGSEVAKQVAAHTSEEALPITFPRVLPPSNVVEAFPNASLAVCLSEAAHRERPHLRRGGAFDWLYAQWVDREIFDGVLTAIDIPWPEGAAQCFSGVTNHDERAAVICLLTAAAVASGSFVAVGEPAGGYFFLPPWKLWDDWARNELDQQRSRLECIHVWIDGMEYVWSEQLPVPEQGLD
jgi:predicted nuclease with RNAse H fold